jgi:hypothetical protein
MKYEKSQYFKGDLAKTIDMAKNTFLPNGFEIIESNNSSLEVTNRSGLWGYNQHPLNGVSKAHIFCSDGRITIKAELGGVTKMIKYLVLFIGGMTVFFLIFFGILFHIQGQPFGKLMRIIWAPFVPWPIIIPLMGVWFKKRACRTLDTLLNNMISGMSLSKAGANRESTNL